MHTENLNSMLTRRHIRAKVMQSIYAFKKGNQVRMQNDKKFLKKSMADMHDLFLLNLSLLVELKNYADNYYEIGKKKFLATDEDKKPNLKFVNNLLIDKIENSTDLSELMEDRKLRNWRDDDEIPKKLGSKLLNSDIYKEYISDTYADFKSDKDFAIRVYKEIIAPDDFLYEYYEDEKLTWLDDFPIVNTGIIKFIQKLKIDEDSIKVPSLFINHDDEEFAMDLFTKTLLNDEELTDAFKDKTPNWDTERIADLDSILIKMALCEFTRFPSIPVRVTINEYLELAKDYSTIKSGTFINGVLDKLSKEFQEAGKINKIGRGLM